MAQNVYDDPDFFARYSRLQRSVLGLAGAPEWPAIRALLPDHHRRAPRSGRMNGHRAALSDAPKEPA